MEKRSNLIIVQPDNIESKNQWPEQVTFVYRGENPFLRSLANELIAKGCPVAVEIKEIPIDTPYKIYKNPEQLKQLTGDLKGRVVTDLTLEEAVVKMTENPINAYRLFSTWEIKDKSDIIQKLKPIVKEIREKDRIPVVLRNALGHHMNIEKKLLQQLSDQDDLDEPDCDEIAVRSGNFYSLLLNQELNVPIITRTMFRFNQNSAYGSIEEALRRLNIEKNKGVLLVDHHVYQLREEELERSGMSSVEIVPICPCCIGLGVGVFVNLEKCGFRVFPLQYVKEKENLLANLMDEIKNSTK